MVRCSACLHDRDRSQFSRKQLEKKTQKDRRCRECIANNAIPSTTIDQICLLSKLPMGILETIVACLEPDDQPAMFMMGLVVGSQAAAQFFGGDGAALIRSSVFSNVIRSNPTAFNQCEKMPREIARLKAAKRDVRIELLMEKNKHRDELERISQQLNEDHDLEMDALNTRYIRRRDRSKTYKLLFKEEQKAAHIFFRHHSNLLQSVLAISRRPDEEDPSTPAAVQNWRTTNTSRVEWENRLIDDARFAIRWSLPNSVIWHPREMAALGMLSQRSEPQHRPRPLRMRCPRCVPPNGVHLFGFPFNSCSCTCDSLTQL